MFSTMQWLSSYVLISLYKTLSYPWFDRFTTELIISEFPFADKHDIKSTKVLMICQKKVDAIWIRATRDISTRERENDPANQNAGTRMVSNKADKTASGEFALDGSYVLQT